MTAEIQGAGGGGKGGKQPTPPVEQPDSLKSRSFAKIVDLLGEGEMYGPINGIAEQCIYLDGTPLQNADGTMNFQQVMVDHRHGTQDQSHIPGFPSIEATTPVGVELTTTTPWNRSITNTQLSAVRIMIGTPTLMRVNTENGDRTGAYVAYRIDLSTDGGAFTQAVISAFNGKNTTGYVRTHRVELPPATTGWTVRVVRLTPDSTDSALQNRTVVESITEVIDAKLRYPNSALVGIQINAEQFSSIPTRAYKWGGLFIRIPSNYDPVTRTYTGTWDGQFIRGFSNNPAWVLYDMAMSDRYGLGEMVTPAMLDRYVLYQIGRYCDELVPDGNGGMEPRFVCNVYLQKAAEALKVMQDFAAIFRGILYWGSGLIYTSADMPTDPVYMYTNAKVKGGRFEYTGSPRHNRKTVALVSWNDPDDFSRAKVEPVENDEGIRRYGVQKITVSPLGCTSRSQAQRVGNYILLTSLMETGGVGFTVGLDGVIPQPGNIIRIADKHRAGRSLGGIVIASTTTTVTIDRDSEIAPGGQFTATLPDGTLQTRTVLSRAGRVVTVTVPFTTPPTVQGQWLIDAEDLVAQYFRVISVREVTGIEFQIQAIAHHPGKYDAIDHGTRLEPLPVTVIPARVQAPPTNVTITSFSIISQGIARTTGVIAWEAAPDAVQYEIEWRRNNNEWVRLPRTGSLNVELQDIYAGDYEARVRALNSFDIASPWVYSVVTPLDGIVGEPPALATLTATGLVMAIRLDWAYPPGRNIFEKVQLRASLTNDFDASYLLTEASYPTNTYTLFGLGYSTEMWFWGRIIDKNGLAGPWFPLETSAGVHGQPDQDPDTILEYLEGQINESHLAPGLIEEITGDAAEGIIEEMQGLLAGDGEGTWYAGDEDGEETFVGTVTYTSMINEGDLRQARKIRSIGAQYGESIAGIREEQIVQANATSALARNQVTVAAQVQDMEAVVEETAEAVVDLDTGLRATYQIKAEVRGDGRVVQTGVALGAAIGEDGSPRSEIIMMADTIAFVNNLNGTLHTPFVFDVANDTAFLRTAFIQDLSVNTIKIADGAVTTMIVASQALGAVPNIPGYDPENPVGPFEITIFSQAINSTGTVVSLSFLLSDYNPPIWRGDFNGKLIHIYRVVGSVETEVLRSGYDRDNSRFEFFDNPGVGVITYRIKVSRPPNPALSIVAPAVYFKIFQNKK